MAPEVKVRLSFDGTPEAIAAVKQFSAAGKKAGSDLARAFDPVTSSLGGVQKLLGALGVALSVGAMVNFGKEVTEAAFRQKLMAEQLGTTIGHFSALNVAAELTNTEMKVLGAGFGLLGRRLDSLKVGEKEATLAFGRLGLTMKDFPTNDIAVATETVARALMKQANGYDRSATMAYIAGRNGKALIPVFEKLVELGGLAGATAFAKKTGFYVDEATIATFQRLVETMKSLKLEASGAMLQFLEGFGPQMVQGIRDLFETVDVQGVGAFKRLGESIGKATRILIAFLASAIAVLSSIPERFQIYFKAMGQSFGAIAQYGPITGNIMANQIMGVARDRQKVMRDENEALIKELFAMARDESGPIATANKDALAANRKNYEEGHATLAEFLEQRQALIAKQLDVEKTVQIKKLREIQNNEKLTDAQRIEQKRAVFQKIGQLEAAALAAANAPAPERKGILPPKGEKGKSDVEARGRALEAEYRAVVAANAAEDEVMKLKYEHGEASLQQYYDTRMNTITENTNAELALLQGKYDLTAQESDLGKRTADRKAIIAEMQAVIAKGEKGYIELLNQEGDEQEKNAAANRQDMVELKRAEDDEHAARMLQIQQQQDAREKLLLRQVQGPLTSESRAAATADAQAYGDSLRAAEAFRVKMQEADLALAQYQNRRAEIQRKVSEQLMTEAQGYEELKKLELDRLPGLQQIGEELRAIADALGPEAQAKVEAFFKGLEKVEYATNQLYKDFKSGLTSALAEAFSTGINSAKSFLGWLGQLALQIALLVQQLLAMKAAQAIVGWLPTGGSSTSASTGTGGYGTGGHWASGGLLVGPSHASGGIPIVAEGREWISPTWLTSAPGILPFFEGLRTRRISTGIIQSLMHGSLAPMFAPSYAEGGLVAPPASTSRMELGGQITVALDQGLILKALESPEGQRTMIRVASRNRRAMGGALR